MTRRSSITISQALAHMYSRHHSRIHLNLSASSPHTSKQKTLRLAHLSVSLLVIYPYSYTHEVDEHVMGGYKFLMRYYSVGDDIYLFGFSRGAYTARFLAEMLDHVGLLSAGNEEMARFAWKAFQRWQQRTENTEKEKQQKKFLMNYLFAFRETFARPVRRIRFLGLFDTVNSVPQFENAFLQRSKFPYTARSTAKVIRHAVAIDERRAKFRQDLIGEVRPDKTHHHYRRRHHLWDKKHGYEDVAPDEILGRGRKLPEAPFEIHNHLAAANGIPTRFRDPSETTGIRSLSPGMNLDSDQCSMASDMSQDSMNMLQRRNGEFQKLNLDSDDDEQDIQEVWFAGAHADIGGGWPLEPGEDAALSHIPLVWMVREAENAGLRFDPKKVRDLNCAEGRRRTLALPVPAIEVDSPTKDPSVKDTEYITDHDDLMLNGNGHAEGSKIQLIEGQPMPKVGVAPQQEPILTVEAEEASASRFVKALHAAAKKGRIHDVLQFNNGSAAIGVIAWNFMEYLPFRRMDLQPDGSWKSINWPLPKGEVRDVSKIVYVPGWKLILMIARFLMTW
jgi:uncharacterized protein (DUF2235 family)